jgi:hypothetical protein
MPTPEELDRISNGMLGKPKCEKCKTRCANFTALVQHLKDAHPEDGSPASA